MKKHLKILIIIFLVFFSFVFSFILKEKYPSIDIESISGEGIFVLSESREKECSGILKNQLLLNESTVKEGEKLNFYVDFKNYRNDKIKIGLDDKNLIELKEGRNKIGLFYYKHQKNYYYSQHCGTQKTKGSGKSSELSIIIERPSFIDTNIGLIVSFFGFFLLFGESLLLSIKLYKFGNFSKKQT